MLLPLTLRERLAPYPFLKLLFPFIVGIVATYGVGYSNWVLVLGFYAIMLLLSTFFVMRRDELGQKYPVLANGTLALSVFLLGALRTSYQQVQPAYSFANESSVYFAEILSEPKPTAKSYKVTASILADDSAMLDNSAKCVLYFSKDSIPGFHFGSRIMLQTSVTRIQGASNPFSFDYASYMARKGIYYQAYVREWVLYDTLSHFSVFAAAHKARNHLLGVFTKFGLTGEGYAVAAALSLGFKDALDPEIKQAFSDTGAMHILAVSGLHVGVVYGFFAMLFRFKPRSKLQRFVRPPLIIFVLWSFAFITGLSPSVIRATSMLSLFLVGEMFGRKVLFFNILASVAFFILVVEPLWLFDVGFQLSFIAVASIVYFVPYLSKWISHPNKFLNWPLELLNMSVAAQAGTGPIAVYYFHKFPAYFLITNLIVVPMATIIVNLSLVVFISSFVSDVLTMYIMWVYSFLVDSLITCVQWISAWPSASISNLNLSMAQVWFSYFILFFLAMWFVFHKRVWITMSIFLLSFILVEESYKVYTRQHTAEFVVFDTRERLTAVIRNGWNSEWIGNPPESFSELSFNVEGYLIKRGIQVPDSTQWKTPDFFMAQNKRVYHVDDKSVWEQYSPNVLELDWLLVSGNHYFEIDDLQRLFKCRLVILDGSFTKAVARKQKEKLEAAGIACHAIPIDGAFVANL